MCILGKQLWTKKELWRLMRKFDSVIWATPEEKKKKKKQTDKDENQSIIKRYGTSLLQKLGIVM